MADSRQRTSSYVGRFAPSPTGPLHLGSLMAALASYLDAKAHGGKWLLRMEDLDPPREPEGAADLILQQLSDLQLHWDGDVLYQSSRLESYGEALKQLDDAGLCFYCDCTRPQIKAMGSVYDGHCRNRKQNAAISAAIRVRTKPISIGFEDHIMGWFSQDLESEVGDFVVKRKDKLFAYQLAVVVDDAFQGVTNIVRGVDLLDSTPRQIYLQQLLNYATPEYSHIPIIVNAEGHKLSKQNFATPIDSKNGKALVHQCLALLGLDPTPALKQAHIQSQLEWAQECWDIQAVPKLANITL